MLVSSDIPIPQLLSTSNLLLWLAEEIRASQHITRSSQKPASACSPVDHGYQHRLLLATTPGTECARQKKGDANIEESGAQGSKGRHPR
jgi:hypothetical protein